MATLSFDGVDDNVQSSNHPGTALDGALSVFVVVRRDGAPAATYESLFHGADSGGDFGWFLAFEYDNGSDTPHRITTWDNTANQYSTNLVPETNRDWWILGVTKASGTAVPRFHMKNLTTGDPWTHEDAAGTATFESISGGSIMLGNATASGLVYDFLGLMALAGAWDVVLTDTQVEELSVNAQTSDWWGNSGGQPVTLTELTSTTPTDLAGLLTWAASGVTTSATDPPGWSFDGQGSSATPVSATRAIEYDVLNTVSAARDVDYDRLATVSAARALEYDALNAVVASRELMYDSIRVVRGQRALIYNVGDVLPSSTQDVRRKTIDQEKAAVFHVGRHR